MGNKYNVKMMWETGEVTYEPFDCLTKDTPVELAHILDVLGWKCFKQYACRKHLVKRLIKQDKLSSFCLPPKYRYGFEVPNNYAHSLKLDQLNGNKKWFDAII